jgi:hypothetical protein
MEANMQQAWSDATNEREQKELLAINRLWIENNADSQQKARELAREAFERHRGRFWSAVRDDAQLRKAFEDAGMKFNGSRTSAPTYTLLDDTKVRMTLEHSTRLADDPTRALSASNLQFVLNDENSVYLEYLRRKDPFQR